MVQARKGEGKFRRKIGEKTGRAYEGRISERNIVVAGGEEKGSESGIRGRKRKKLKAQSIL